MNPRQIVAGYLFFQAIGVAVWWVLLLWVPPSVKWFQPEDWPADALIGFWLSDLLLLVGGSVVAAIAVLRRTVWAALAVWSLAIVVWYPTLYCIGVSVITGEAWIASAMMASMAGLTLAIATIHGNAVQSPATIRVTAMNVPTALAWTFVETSFFWSLFLWILPMGIVELEDRLGWSAFVHAGQVGFSVLLFVTASALGVWSGVSMAVYGDGTPLPTATAPKLVIAGPYRFVRNPMAVAGILQGIAVGWFLGSFAVIGYAVAGALAWHGFVRPVEEGDLHKRFGDDYMRYQKNVSLWVPSFVTRSSTKGL